MDEVEKRIGEVPGVESVTVNYAAGSATVRYDETRLEISDIKSAVCQRGYKSAGESLPKPVSEPKPAHKDTGAPSPQAGPAFFPLKPRQAEVERMNELDTKMAAPDENDWGSRSHVQTLVLMVATAFGIHLCYRLAVPFLPALAWALALAVLFTPFQRWLESKLKHPRMAALVSVLMIGLIVVIPATFVAQRLVVQAAKGAELIETKVNSGEWRRAIEAQPRLASLADRIERQLDLPKNVKALVTRLSATAGSIVKGSVFQVVGLCLAFYLLFFFLRDRRAALQSLRSLSPLSEAEMDRLFGRVGDTIHATIYGTLAVSSVQGLLGGLMFWWLGLSAPLLWGVVMALLAVVPVLGAFVVGIPASLFLALEGSWGKALILTLWGILVVGTIDKLLRPVLVGKRLKLHTVLAFISVVGGRILFGPGGLILGPVALTVTMVLLEIWSDRVNQMIAN